MNKIKKSIETELETIQFHTRRLLRLNNHSEERCKSGFHVLDHDHGINCIEAPGVSCLVCDYEDQFLNSEISEEGYLIEKLLENDWAITPSDREKQRQENVRSLAMFLHPESEIRLDYQNSEQIPDSKNLKWDIRNKND